ncbi:MAG: hypothetical protein J6X86_05125 [Bacteroidales bacterium]|nr:hypothetical protein [Bacteroidales bacterium]
MAIFLGVCATVLAVQSCTKERTCRCSVLGEQTIRVIKIDKGTCDQLRYVLFDRDPVLYPDITDSVLCTDFDFESYEN